MDTILADFHSKRQDLLGHIRLLQTQTQEKSNTLKDELDPYDLAATEIMSQLIVELQQHTRRSKNPTADSLQECLNKIEDLRSSHSRSHTTLEQICGQFGSLIAAVVDLEEQQFKVLSEALRRLLTLSGARDHVSDFRYEVYYDVIDHEPDMMQRFPTLSSFLTAITDEHRAFRDRRIPSRPLAVKFSAAVVRLGLSVQEWQRLKVLGANSVEAFHCKFTLAELQAVPFPSDLEQCRPVLVKAARKVQELKEARTQAAEPTVEEVEEVDFF